MHTCLFGSRCRCLQGQPPIQSAMTALPLPDSDTLLPDRLEPGRSSPNGLFQAACLQPSLSSQTARHRERLTRHNVASSRVAGPLGTASGKGARCHVHGSRALQGLPRGSHCCAQARIGRAIKPLKIQLWPPVAVQVLDRIQDMCCRAEFGTRTHQHQTSSPLIPLHPPKQRCNRHVTRMLRSARQR